MKQSFIIIYSVVFVFIVILKLGVDDYYGKRHPTIAEAIPSSRDISSGSLSMQSLCMACHLAQENHDHQEQGLAPPMWGVRNHYLEEYPSRDAFIEAVSNHVRNPNKKKSLMKNAIKRFGLMPPLLLHDKDIGNIAAAIFEGKGFTKPTWWDAHMREHRMEKHLDRDSIEKH